MKKLLLFLALSSSLLAFKCSAQFTDMLNFKNTNAPKGKGPYGDLALSGNNMLYGMTELGGASSKGCIFFIHTSGSGYTVLHSFNGSKGKNPFGGVTLLNNKLYGMTYFGGNPHDSGVIFSMDTDGHAFKVLTNFNGTSGADPLGTLTLAGNKLFGTTELGGNPHDSGVIFSIDTNGAAYKVLYNFNGTSGSDPVGTLLFSGNTLYGMTKLGGTHDSGCIFSIDTNGRKYKILYNFSGTDGSEPQGSLAFSGGTLFGKTSKGGVNDLGLVFSIDTNGGGYRDLLDFNGTNGKYPYGSFTLSGSVLFGMTSYGGAHDSGCIFSLDTNGSGYKDLFDFNGTNGAYPYGNVTISGDLLYGMTNKGGTHIDGVIFSDFSCTLGVTASAIGISCNGGSNGSATANLTGGASPYTYLWNDASSQTIATATGLSVGTYTVTVNDIHACSATASATITQPASALAITIASENNVQCSGGTGSITANAATGGTSPYTYLWNDANSQTTVGATALSAGTYTITATDNNGCTATTSATITQPASGVTITIASYTNSGGCTPTGSATANAATGGASPYTYNWTPSGGTNLTATALSGGTYTITATDNNGCSATASVLITQPVSPVSITIASYTNSGGCTPNGSATANAAIGGASPYTYNWTPSGGTNLTASGLSGGTYTITATDNNGCNATASVLITQPVGVSITIASQSNILCNGGTGSATANAATGGASPYTYLWSDASSQTSLNATGLSAGSYTITATDNNACTSNATVTITQPASALAITIASQNNLMCFGTGSAGGYTDVLDFNGTNGNNSSGNLTLSGSVLYGMTQNGGVNSVGNIFSINTNGSGYTDLYDFSNGEYPYGSLTISGSVLYGMTSAGGASGNGNIFSINTNGSGFTDLLDFNGTLFPEGSDPEGSLTLSGTVLYGMTPQGGVNSDGNIFSVNTNGSGYTDLRDFSGIDGTAPFGDLILSGSVLYGMTQQGGVNSDGNIFSIKTTGGGYFDLLDFNGTNGEYPYGSLTLSGSVLYGMTNDGGANVEGNIFSINTNGSGYSDLFDFNGSNGAAPFGDLTLSGSILYGMTDLSGVSNYGNVFFINTNGGGYQDLFDFNSTTGQNPYGDLTLAGSMFFGMTQLGGANNDGVVFSYSNPTYPGNATANAATGGTSPYTYNWTPNGGTGLTGTYLSAGTYTITATDNNGCTATASATITQPTALGITIASQSNVLCNGGTGSATANTATGGTSPYTYLWNDANSQTTVNATGLSAGIYTITATDNNGCADTASVTITQPASAIAITIASFTNSGGCSPNGSATANAATGGTSPYTYNWTPSGGTNLIASGLSGGTYTITATDNNGCSATASVLITQPVGVSITIASQTNIQCNGGTGSAITNAATGGTSPYTYLWSDASSQTSLTATGLSAGTYTITATDNTACTATASVTITQPTALSVAPTAPGILCNGGTASASSGVSGGTPPYTYSWNDGSTQTTDPATGLSAGTYTITVTDNNACTASAFVTITQPASALAITMASFTNSGGCSPNGSATANAAMGGTSPYTYNWTPSGGINLTASALSGGTYTITATDNNGCTATASATITQPGSSVDITIASQTNILCNGGTGSATANAATGGTSPYTYLWNDASSQTTVNATGLSAGTYTITATDNTACTATASVTITQPTALSVAPTAPGILCNGGTASASSGVSGGTSPYTYLWNDGSTQTTDPAMGLSAGSYTVMVFDNNNCSASASVTITQPTALSVAPTAPGILCNGGTASASSGVSGGTSPYTYLWNDGGTQTTDPATGLSAGSYTVTVTDNNNCSASASVTITEPASAPAITISSSTNSGGCIPTGSATANAAIGGTSPYTYNWTPSGGTNLTASGLSGGTYTITATDNNGCTATSSATITQPASSLSITIASQNNILCNGVNTGNATANAATSGAAPYTYLWNDASSQTSLTAIGLSAGSYTITATDNNGCTATASVTITQPASALDITMASHINVLCNGGTGSATANTATGGTLPYTYLWNDANSQTTVNATGLSTGSYTITATDNHACTATASVTLTQPATALDITMASHVNVLCNGGIGSATANTATGGTSPYTYLWNDASSQATVNATGLSAGTYTITATDNHACTATASVTLTQPASALDITMASHVNVLCNGGTGSATANTATGGTSPYTYLWNDASSQTTVNATGLSAGSYTITATDNHACTATALITITQPASALDVTMASHVNVLCNGGTGSATANTATGGTSPYTYLWNDASSQTTIHATGLSAGSYTITATDNHVCTATVSVTITQPASALDITMASHVNVLCNGGTGSATANTATGGTSPYTYLWNDASSQTTIHATGLSAGSYTITATDNHVCTATVSVTITQPASALDITMASHVNVLCNGGTGSATANTATGGTSPYTYLWNDASSQTTIHATGLSAGSYTITATDNHACTATALITITQPASALDVTMASHVNVLCNGGTGSATANTATGGTSPYTYLWNDASSQTTIHATGLSAGSYTITATDNHVCTATVSVTITQPASALDITMASHVNVLCNGGTGSATANTATGGTSPYTYLWNDASSQTTIHATGLSAGSYTITATDNHVCTATVSVTITQPASALDITMASHVNVLCNGGTGSATANTATGGTSPYTYLWNDASSQTTIHATGLSAGSYTITATDNHACTATALITITQPASALDITMASHVNVLCNGGTGSATANTATGGTSPYTYLWNDASSQTTINATGLSAGSYTITTTDNHACTATASVTITQPASALDITMASHINVLCNGGTGSATANTATGGTSPYTYLWNDASSQTTIHATGLSAGSYTITATDNHVCTATVSVTITQPASALDITMASHVNVLCNGGTGSAIANTATGGTSPYTYLWNDANSQTTINATGLSAGTYTITATDNHACTATASVTITQPASALDITMASHINVLCNGGTGNATANTATGGTSPYTYLWNDASSQATVNATGLSAGTYTITATDNHACTATASVTLTQPASALVITIASSTNSGGCNPNGSITANAATGGTSPYTYNWTPSGGIGLVASGLSGGIYTITATDNNGCSSTASATITQPAGSISITIASQNNILCNGGTGSAIANTAIGGTPPYTYLWSDASSQTTLTATGLSAGSYTITATDNIGCNDFATVTITQPTGITITHDSVNDNGTCNGLAAVTATGGTAPYTYLWTTGSQTTDTIKNQCGGTSYCCDITDNNGCTTTTCITIKLSTGENGINITSLINIYPDPNTGQFTVTGVARGQAIELYDYLGQKLSSIMANDATMHFDISTKANGIYLVRILNKDGSLVTQKKMVKTQ